VTLHPHHVNRLCYYTTAVQMALDALSPQSVSCGQWLKYG